MRSSLSDSRNSFDFFLRRKLSLSRRRYREKGVDLRSLLDDLSPDDARLVSRLIWRYEFEPFLKYLQPQSFFDNVMHLMLLDRISASLPVRSVKRVLDIGSKNFAYMPCLSSFIKTWQAKHFDCSSDVEITGIELDVHRVNKSFYTRAALARYYSGLVPESTYIEGDVLATPFPEPFDLICHFFPFIELATVLDYGLPSKFFRPLELFQRSYELLAPGGIFIMANTTKNEFLQGKALAIACELEFLNGEEVDGGGFTPHPLYVSVFRR